MTLPPYGLCLPVVYRRCRDGDTVEVALYGSKRVWAVRLRDCWCAESNTKAGKAATQFAEDILSAAKQVSVFIQMSADANNILANLTTFDRILGCIFVDNEQTLNEMLVNGGHATKTKQKSKQSGDHQ